MRQQQAADVAVRVQQLKRTAGGDVSCVGGRDVWEGEGGIEGDGEAGRVCTGFGAKHRAGLQRTHLMVTA